jgi:hypothetical protein
MRTTLPSWPEPSVPCQAHKQDLALPGAPLCSLSMIAAQVRVRSYANRNQLAADPRDRAEQLLEWERHYLTVLGTANQRLYSFRLQTASKTYDAAKARPQLPWAHACERGCLGVIGLLDVM